MNEERRGPRVDDFYELYEERTHKASDPLEEMLAAVENATQGNGFKVVKQGQATEEGTIQLTYQRKPDQVLPYSIDLAVELNPQKGCTILFTPEDGPNRFPYTTLKPIPHQSIILHILGYIEASENGRAYDGSNPLED